MINHNKEVVVPLFRSYAELQEDEAKIMSEYATAWEAAFVCHDLAEVEIAKMESAPAGASLYKSDPIDQIITKLAGHGIADNLKLIKSSFEDLRDRNRDLKKQLEIIVARRKAQADLIAGLKAAVQKRDDRLFGLGDVAKRSLRFASVQRRQYHGAPATVSQIGSK